MKRNRLLGLALAGVVGSGAIGWVAGTQVQSSNEASAAAKPPAASAVTAAVKRQALAATIVTRGTAQYGEPTKVNLAAGAGGELVTRPPESEKDLNEGGAFMEANGHPVFALQGDRPMYRDLRPGETGEDVRQLEEALARLGFDPGVVDGVYDGATASAVDRWYTAAGYSAQGPTEAERSELRSAANGVDQAQSALAAARRQLADGTKPPTEVELLQSQNELRQAEEALANAKTSATDKNAAAERNVTAKYDALNAAKAKAIDDVDAARRNVDDKYVAAQIARAGLSNARSAPPEQGGGQLAILQAEQAVKRAEQDLVAARAARDRLPDETAKAIAEAEQALTDARAALPRTRTDGENAIKGAETALTLAQLRLKALREPKTSESLSTAVRDAESALAKAQAALAETQTGTGVKVGASSVVFFSKLPLRIDSVKVKRGDSASGEIMTVSGAKLEVEAAVTIAEAKLLKSGMEVQIEAPDLSLNLTGKVSQIAEKPGTEGADSQHIHISVEPMDPPTNFKDAAVKITIPVKSTAGDVLTVPVAAVTSGADGSARVQVDEGGKQRDVSVRAGLSAGGIVEVTPINEDLKEGDRVVVASK